MTRERECRCGKSLDVRDAICPSCGTRFASGGSVSGALLATALAGPPNFIPAGGICWRAPDGSHEWLMPARMSVPPDEEK